jgi:hypothetical protein
LVGAHYKYKNLPASEKSQYVLKKIILFKKKLKISLKKTLKFQEKNIKFSRIAKSQI